MSSAATPLLGEESEGMSPPLATRSRLLNVPRRDAHRSRSVSASKRLKPSPVWILCLCAIAAISTSGTAAPRVELYTRTVCASHGLDPAECNTPEVSAAAAELMATLMTLSGALAMLTAAWWGSLSDSYGRIGVLGFNVLGLMLSDVGFLTVCHFWQSLPGTYWWFAVGPVCEGLVGGISVASIVMHAYISDCCEPAARSRAFSLLMGIIFVGMSIGPILTGYIMRSTGLILPVFYATATIDLIVTLGVWFVIPESLSQEEMQHRRALRKAASQAMSPLKRLASSFDFISPLALLLPHRTEHSTSKKSIDWTMTILGCAFGFGTLVQASTVQQIQYAYYAMKWSSDMVSYWLGCAHIVRAVYLTMIFPTVMKLFSYLWTSSRRFTPSDTGNLPSEDAERAQAGPLTNAKSHAASVDLFLARAALVTDAVFYALCFTTDSGKLFAVFSISVSFGQSFAPTMQSVALSLYEKRGGRDTGRLLGALTVVSAFSSHIIGPAVFGMTYAQTVATVPGAFYLVCCASVVAGLLLRATVSRPLRPQPRATSRDPLLRSRAQQSQPRSRPRPPHLSHSTTDSIGQLPGPADLLNPSSSLVSEEQVELLHEFVHPHHGAEETLVNDAAFGEEQGFAKDDGDENAWMMQRPWWRRPSPYWFLAFIPFTAIAMGITVAAKIELFTYLVCLAIQPTVSPDHGLTFCGDVAPSQGVCKTDPVVAAGVAKLTTLMTTSGGIIACMTTAWWGSLSDRVGRIRILGCAVIGLLIADLTFLAVFWFYDYLPGGYWFLMLGPLCEGLLGGRHLLSATVHAYFADTSPPHLRSRLFSLDLGLMFTGIALGPALGGVLVRVTGSFMIVFYISAIIHLIYALLLWFIIPESLSPKKMQDARQRYKLDIEEYKAAHAEGGILVFLQRIFSFLSPISLFFPVDLNKGGNPAKGKRWDWSLMLIAAAYTFVIANLGMYLFTIQYMSTVYGWSTENINYWFSSVGVSRAVFLTLILPTIIRIFKPKPVQLPVEPVEPLSPTTTSTFPQPPEAQRAASQERATAAAVTAHKTAKFDLALARGSVFVDILTMLAMLASSSGAASLGMGFMPAVHSVALALYQRRGGRDRAPGAELGVVGPFVYGLTYARTVGTFPKMIFVLATCSLTLAFVLVMCVRLPEGDLAGRTDEEERQPLVAGENEDEDEDDRRRDTLVGAPEPLVVVDDGEGRAVVKPVPEV
ncbi:MFS general substrate transporter [Epithele typhae]|uniref:MFS general substrate transporter n=1 Tax=Epithele typhae TaxID=378194 RepID=UPI002008133B|nr:MFS general substrate transporter [Epithele typhae]KAH9945899.1 MFS general substrate transporter [Epithele typhae]